MKVQSRRGSKNFRQGGGGVQLSKKEKKEEERKQRGSGVLFFLQKYGLNQLSKQVYCR